MISFTSSNTSDRHRNRRHGARCRGTARSSAERRASPYSRQCRSPSSRPEQGARPRQKVPRVARPGGERPVAGNGQRRLTTRTEKVRPSPPSFGAAETRQLADFRRSGAVEALAGGADPETLSSKMADTLSASNRLHKTYGPVQCAKVLDADAARLRARAKLRKQKADDSRPPPARESPARKS